MSLQEAKDQVAINHEYQDWHCMTALFHPKEQYSDEAALLYGDSQYNQAINDAVTRLTVLGMWPNELFEELKKLKR